MTSPQSHLRFDAPAIFVRVAHAAWRVILFPFGYQQIVNQEPRSESGIQRLTEAHVGEIAEASSPDAEGYNLKYSPFSSSFPKWNRSSAPERTEEDRNFLAEIKNAAKLAEQRHASALRSKYGPNIPPAPVQKNADPNPQEIARLLGGKIVRP